MKRVIIVPATETRHFPGVTIIARGSSICALLDESSRERSRAAFDCDETFLAAVASGRADLNTFETDNLAMAFAVERIKLLAEKARRIEEALLGLSAFPVRKASPSVEGGPSLAKSA